MSRLDSLLNKWRKSSATEKKASIHKKVCPRIAIKEPTT